MFGGLKKSCTFAYPFTVRGVNNKLNLFIMENLIETYKKNGGIWYVHSGNEGILCYPNELHHSTESIMAFVPFVDMSEETLTNINDKDYKSCCTYTDSYSGDSGLSIGCEIDQDYITNYENEDEIIFVWETIDELKSDEYFRELFVYKYDEVFHSSCRAIMQNTIEKLFNTTTDEVEIENRLKAYKKEWEKIVSNFSDPMGYHDYPEFSGIVEDVKEYMS